MASTDALPIPRKNTAYRVVFPLLDADGDLVTGAAGLDSEISKDQGTFADCTNEATEIASASGMYYLDLTATEMNADCVAIIVKTSTPGAKTTPIVLYPLEDGDWRVNVVQFGGAAGTFASGRPEVNATHIAGSSVSTSSAQLGVNVVNAAGTAWGSGAITAAALAADAITAAKIADGAIDRATFAADTGHQSARSGTAQAGAAGTITLDASASAVTDFYVGMWIVLTGSTGAGQARVCTAYNGTTKVATIAPNWATNPAATTTFAVMNAAQLTGVQGNVTGSAASVTGAVGSVTGNVGGNVVGSVASVTGNVGGNVVGSVASVTAAPPDSSGVTTLLSRLSSARAGYLDNLSAGAAALESSLQALITTIGASAAGVATAVWANATRLLTAGTNIVLAKGTGVTGFTDLDAPGVRSAVGLASANLDTQLGTIDDFLDTEIAAIKAKTDNLPASPAAVGSAMTLTGAYDAAKTAAQAGDAMALTSGERTSTGTAVWATTTRRLTDGTNIALAKGTGVTGFNDLDAAGVRTAVGLGSANLDTQLGDLPTNAELATALGGADDAVLARLSTLPTKTATVLADAGNSATQILTDLTETEVGHWAFALVKVTSGALAQQVRKVTGYDGAGTLTFAEGFTDTPANGVTIELVND